jgi:superfamily I DNA and RNA helicase
MAQMFPTRPSPQTQSRAELILFEEFQNKLSNEYSVIHSKKWIHSDKNGKKFIQGECDFIVIHISKGILFIEAKSGKTFYCSAIEDYWFDIDKNEKFRNPLNQVINSQFAIIKKLESQLHEPIRLPYNFALAFPEATHIYENLPDELKPQMVFIKTDLSNIQKKIDKALAVVKKHPKIPISIETYKKILKFLRSEFQITVSLLTRLDDLNSQFFQLEQEQSDVLDIFENNSRVLVEGCAGSGKTLLAIEKAQRASIAGKNVLLLCYNIPLAQQIKQRITDLKLNVDVFNFHGLCEHVVKAIGGTFEIDNENLNYFYDVQCPNMLLDAIPSFAKSYDCIIVDEAQDFMGEWWIPIMDLLTNQKDSQIFIFRDLNQNIFSRDNSIPIETLTKIKLNKNYRNTPAIVKWINKVCDTDIIPSKQIDEGIKPEVRKLKKSEQELNEVQKIISILIKKEHLKPDQIIILGRHPLKRSVFSSCESIEGFKLIENQLAIGNSKNIRYSSIYKFKGLEADCVLLTGLEDDSRHDIKENMKAVMFTGASRAKSLLYVFGQQSPILG